MVLPLIALGVAAAASPHYGNYQRRVRGNYNERAMQGVDMSDPAAVNQQLFNAGLLQPDQFQGDIRDAFEGQQNRANALQRAQISAGPGYMQAQLARDKHNRQVALEEQIRMGEERAMEAAGYDKNSPFYSVVKKHVLGQLGLDAAAEVARSNFEASYGPDGQPQPQTIEQWLALEEQKAAQEQAAADKAAAENAAWMAYDKERQPVMNNLDMITEAQKELKNVTFDKPGLSSEDERNSAAFLNRTVDWLRSDYWTEFMGRGDAPGQEEWQRVMERFPDASATAAWNDERVRADVEYILRMAERNLNVKGTTIMNNFTGQGAQNFAPDFNDDSWRYHSRWGQ